MLEPRLLIEDPGKSYGDPHSENMLIHGDNLLALKALGKKWFAFSKIDKDALQVVEKLGKWTESHGRMESI